MFLFWVWICCIKGYRGSFSFLPLTTLYRIRPILTSVILLRDFSPIGWEDGAARCLVALYHCTFCVFIDKVVHLFEGIIYASSRRRFLLFSFDFSCHCIPVSKLLLGWGRVGGCSSCRLRWGCLNGADSSITNLKEAPIHLFFCLLELDIDALSCAWELTIVRVDRVSKFDLGKDFSSLRVF